ncbi:hypothetical protein [uncultured Limimaricola sp.]|uniref:hypothetical protein n=1 Tax=uncultured Limimaricola sp. TaxID=2211667 RepID=UPI0030FCBFAC
MLAEIIKGMAMPHDEGRHGSHATEAFPRRMTGQYALDPMPMAHGAVITTWR